MRVIIKLKKPLENGYKKVREKVLLLPKVNWVRCVISLKNMIGLCIGLKKVQHRKTHSVNIISVLCTEKDLGWKKIRTKLFIGLKRVLSKVFLLQSMIWGIFIKTE